MSRRASILLIAVVVGIAVLFWSAVVGWFIVASRDIAPPDTADLVLAPIQVSDADNAYTYFKKAGELLQWPRDESGIQAMLDGKTWDDAGAADLIFKNADVFPLLKQGIACSIYSPPGLPEPNRAEPLWRRLRMSRLMAVKAMRERRMGDTREAWETCRDLLQFGSLIAANPNSVLDCYAGMVTLDLAFKEIRRSLGTLSSDKVLLGTLLDRLRRTASLDRGWASAIRRQFKLFVGAVDHVNSATTSSFFGNYAFQPNRTIETCLPFYRGVIQSLSEPYAEVQVPEPKLIAVEGVHRHLLLLHRNNQGHVLIRMILLAPDRVNGIMTRKCTMQSHLDGLRLVVACRLYEIRYGRLPETLDRLVPEWLSAVPRDPFDGKPFRYAREDAVVYSVGKDLKDSWISEEHSPDALLPRDLSLSTRVQKKVDDLVYALVTRSKVE
jgi:hypothetical protein